jgi:hypothetical protein
MAVDDLSPWIVSRQEAKRLGLKFYFTGKPCRHGHIAASGIGRATLARTSRVKSGGVGKIPTR